jgi:hypothetical protein
MPESGGGIVQKYRALCLRMEIAWLKVRNRFGRSEVATGDAGAVVSLTTYGKRAQDVYLAIESIARGTMLPSRMILWLDDTALFANPGPQLVRLSRRGLEIRFCKNYGPHKKYYPYVEKHREFSAPLVTADDDAIYSRTWLAGLMDAYTRFPENVNCYRARVMLLRDGKIAPYREWPLCESSEPSYRIVATGVSGIIYPPMLLEVLKRAGTGFESTCPRADDLWLHAHAIRSGFKIRQMQQEPANFPHIPGSQAASLWAENCVLDDGNDKQSSATYDASDLEVLGRSAAAVSLA